MPSPRNPPGEGNVLFSSTTTEACCWGEIPEVGVVARLGTDAVVAQEIAGLTRPSPYPPTTPVLGPVAVNVLVTLPIRKWSFNCILCPIEA